MVKQLINDLSSTEENWAGFQTVRKDGNDLDVNEGKARTVPLMKPTYWDWTIEAGLFTNATVSLRKAVTDTFKSFDTGTQHALTFVPKTAGEWASRARLWENALRWVLPPEQYHTAMVKILSWFVHCAIQTF